MLESEFKQNLSEAVEAILKGNLSLGKKMAHALPQGYDNKSQEFGVACAFLGIILSRGQDPKNLGKILANLPGHQAAEKANNLSAILLAGLNDSAQKAYGENTL